MTGRELIPYDQRAFARNKARVERGFWAKLRRNLGRIPFVEDAIAAYFCARDPDTPLRVKAVLLAALAYFIIPTDMIPDFLVSFGFTDDAAVLYVAVTSVAGHVNERHRKAARRVLVRLRRQA
jgi:uncharacterized membrane protein YkvA (DUF1232 family)